MTRTRTNWKVRDHVFTIGERTLIMGVLNVTPDSFSDGGRYLDPDAAVARALQLEQQGADILDIGAESTRPGSERINEGEELRRLVPVLKRLKDRLSIPISVDTYKAAVAEKALEHGASIINDISALTWEPDILKPVVKYDAGLILNHMRGTPETWARLGPMKDVMGTLVAELEAAIHRAIRGSVARERVVIDPGIGFGKRGEQNSEILARLGELQRLGYPILVAASRKSFLAQDDPAALEFATAAAVTTAILNGAAIVRVHDVAAMKPVVKTVDAIIEATPEREERPKPAGKVRLDADVQAERRARPVRPATIVKKEEPSIPPPQEPRPERPPVRAKEEEFPRRPFERRSAVPEQPPVRREGGSREAKPYERRDRPFRTGPERGGDKPERRPYQRSGPPARKAGPGDAKPRDAKPRDAKPYERRDRPFRTGPERGGDKPERRPYQRSGPPARKAGPGDAKPRDAKPYERRDRPFRPRDDERGDRAEPRPYQRADRTQDRSDRRPPAGRPYEKRSGPFPPRDDKSGPSKFGGRGGGGKRPSGPKGDDRPGGGRPRQGGGKGPFGPKRGGGGPPRKRS